jgi:molybdopterin-containing oxidoreductase family membrane subunit
VDLGLVERVARVIGWGLLGYLYLRFWDAFAMTYTYTPGRTEALRLLTKGPLAFNFWFGELLVGALIPAALLLRTAWRRDPRLLAAALAMAVGGVAAYRWDTNLLGQMVVIQPFGAAGGLLYAAYTPALVEWLSAAGVLAFGALLLTLGVKYLRVVDHNHESCRA